MTCEASASRRCDPLRHRGDPEAATRTYHPETHVEGTRYRDGMERARSDLNLFLAAAAALAISGGIIYAVVDVSMVAATADSNTSNGTTPGPPSSFEQP